MLSRGYSGVTIWLLAWPKGVAVAARHYYWNCNCARVTSKAPHPPILHSYQPTMLHSLRLLASILTGVALLALESQAYALASEQQKVLSRPVQVGNWTQAQETCGRLKRFLASEVDLEEVLDIAVVRADPAV